jgi:hypothetical protein
MMINKNWDFDNLSVTFEWTRVLTEKKAKMFQTMEFIIQSD